MSLTTFLNIGQPEVSPRIPIRQLLVVDADLVQDRGVQIVNRHAILGSAEPEFIRCITTQAEARASL